MPPKTAPRRGIAPYGWRWEGRKLVEDAHEQHVRWLILHMRRRAYSLTQIAAELKRLDLAARDGGDWPKTTVHRVVVTAHRLEATG